MSERLRPFIAPVYLFLCLVLGGSGQGVWGNAALRLLAIVLIAWAVLERRESALPRAVRQLLLLIGLAIGLAALQLIPLPLPIWSSLPGHAQLAAGSQLLGVEPAAMPLSLSPYDGIATLLALLPALGMVAAMLGQRGASTRWMAAALVAGTILGVLLGVLQVTSGDPPHSHWYLYSQSNFGVATGFFANGNHMASLLLVAIPFVAALGVTVRERAKDLRLRSAAVALFCGGLLVIVIGLVLNGSLAGYGLGLPVVLASLLILFGAQPRLARGALAAVLVATVVALGLLWASPVDQGASTSVSTRQEIATESVDLLGQYGPTGTGVGTFEKVYRLKERPELVDRIYVNHAHNDYLELAVETGLPGILLLLLFLAWWGRSVLAMVRSPAADQFAFAGAIASGTLLLHSAVDYPLRTAAMSAVFAMCLLLVVQSRRSAHHERDLRPARHIVID